MSIAYAAAVPAYVGLTTILFLSYSSIECTKDKGKLDDSSRSFLSIWCIVSFIVTTVIGGAVGGAMSGDLNTTYLLIAGLLACVTLIISSGMIYWS